MPERGPPPLTERAASPVASALREVCQKMKQIIIDAVMRINIAQRLGWTYSRYPNQHWLNAQQSSNQGETKIAKKILTADGSPTLRCCTIGPLLALKRPTPRAALFTLVLAFGIKPKADTALKQKTRDRIFMMDSIGWFYAVRAVRSVCIFLPPPDG